MINKIFTGLVSYFSKPQSRKETLVELVGKEDLIELDCSSTL